MRSVSAQRPCIMSDRRNTISTLPRLAQRRPKDTAKSKANHYGTTWLPRPGQQGTPNQSLPCTLTKSAHAMTIAALISFPMFSPFDRLWYDTPDNAIGYAMHRSHSHDAVIRVCNAVETHEHKGDFREF